MKERFTNLCRRVGWAKLGWYGALMALLVLLGAGAYGYRTHHAAGVAPMPTPAAVMAVSTQEPFAALAAVTPIPTPEPYVWPLDGEIIGRYAADHMVWSEALSQYQSHPALDIAGALGEAVAACADGEVTDAWEDRLWGNVIEITHAGGCVSTYANLSTLKLVNVGDRVTAGQVISAVGSPAPAEADLPPHLHFAFTRMGEAVSFESLMSDAAQTERSPSE